MLGVSIPQGFDEILGVTHDSRAVKPGFAFVAIPGFKRDGVDFVPDARRRGAVLAVAEREVSGTPTAVVKDAREALAVLASAIFEHPSKDLEVYGVTGTNGKTTTSYALHAIFSRAGESGLMTTTEVVIGAERRPASRTTPEAVEVQETLDSMRRSGVRRVVMEVSSHGIELKRVLGTRFAGALFTNLTRDHLDLHGSMQAYYEAKRRLFEWTAGPKLANIDDPWGMRLAQEIQGVKSFGTSREADYRIDGVSMGRGGSKFRLEYPGGSLDMEVPLVGEYNVLNVTGAAALALEAGIGAETVYRAVREMPQVPGRFEQLETGRGFKVVVDYAHTEVGLAAALKVARWMAEAADGRVIVVFGAAGDRDPAKRPLMGQVATELAEWSIITTDDAYSEDPAQIAREVASGAAKGRYEIITGRVEAIRRALKMAGKGDVVVVAGKGHESVQHLPTGDIALNDTSVVRDLLSEMSC